MTWSAQQYMTFEGERTRPVRDLLGASPPIEARAVIDIGCGPGNSTEVLAARFPGAAVSGVDSSLDMIAAARARLPGVIFQVGDIERWLYDTGNGDTPDEDTTVRGVAEAVGRFDVILANAVLQWVPDHAKLFPALAARLAPGGALAVQMPDNIEEPSHRLMREIASDGPWAERLAAAAGARTPIAAAGWYYDSLRAAGCAVDVWRTTYHHPLAGGAAAIVEWFEGSGLRPFIDLLEAEERAVYLARYREAVAKAYPALADGSVLLPFPRLFMVAVH